MSVEKDRLELSTQGTPSLLPGLKSQGARAKKLKLDELVSRTYPLAGINDAFAALEQGEVARSIISYD